MIGWGAHFQVSGLSKQEPGSGDQVQVRVQEIWPLTTVIDSAFLSFRVAGGSLGWQVAGLIHSVLHAVLNAALNSVLPFHPCHPSSVIDSAIHAAPVSRHTLPHYPILSAFFPTANR